MAQEQPLLLSLVATKVRPYPRFCLSHFGVSAQILPFSGIALMLGPLKIPRVLCARLRRIRQPLRLMSDTLPF